MAGKKAQAPDFNVVFVGQSGRLAYEAVAFAATFRAANPDFTGRLVMLEPLPSSMSAAPGPMISAISPAWASRIESSVRVG